MNEINKLVQLVNEDHNTNKKPAKFSWWLFKAQWILLLMVLGILGIILMAVLISRAL